MNGMCYPTTGAMCATCKQRENSEIARALVERMMRESKWVRN